MILQHHKWTPAGQELRDRLSQNPDYPVWPNYPRPQLQRTADSWLNLNGYWDYAFADLTEQDYPFRDYWLPVKSSDIHQPLAPWVDFSAQGKILVPFAPETLLSGVGRQLQPDQKLYYRRQFTWPGLADRLLAGDRLFLHFGAVDQLCSVWLDGHYVGSHRDGYLPFSFEVTDFWDDQLASHQLQLVVFDPSDQGVLPWGKQTLERGGIWYTASSGIWQTVWLELVPATFIENYYYTYDSDRAQLNLNLLINSAKASTDKSAMSRTSRSMSSETGSWQIMTWPADGAEAAMVKLQVSVSVVQPGQQWLQVELDLQDRQVQLWSPSNPYLYDLDLTFCMAGTDRVMDRLRGYFALRTIGTGQDSKGYPCLLLNGQPLNHIGLLDQGYWSDGLYTPATDACLTADLQMAKELGFNTIRKHIKIEPARWYYHCDRLGLLVWQDMVNGGNSYSDFTTRYWPFIGVKLQDQHYGRFGRDQNKLISADLARAGRLAAKAIMVETVEALRVFPSIVLWTIFNEAWGQFDSLAIGQAIKQLDPSRLIDHASGWHDQGGLDLQSEHIYFRRIKSKPDGSGRPLALTEYGGYSYAPDEVTTSTKAYGYKKYKNLTAYQQAVLDLLHREVMPLVGLKAAIYTQLSDVEDEINGLVSYDRRFHKWLASPAQEELVSINQHLADLYMLILKSCFIGTTTKPVLEFLIGQTKGVTMLQVTIFESSKVPLDPLVCSSMGKVLWNNKALRAFLDCIITYGLGCCDCFINIPLD